MQLKLRPKNSLKTKKSSKYERLSWWRRETQKGIIIGHKGSALKRVGMEARKDLETFFDKKIFLDLYVKVNKNWRNDSKQLRRFGYND